MHLSPRSPRQPWSTDNVIVPAFISSPATYFSCHHFLCCHQMLASRLTAYFRKKCVVVTDRRVRLMNEILVCIKFIKMYCWEDSFAQNIHSEWLSQMTPQYHNTPIVLCCSGLLVSGFLVCLFFFNSQLHQGKGSSFKYLQITFANDWLIGKFISWN